MCDKDECKQQGNKNDTEEYLNNTVDIKCKFQQVIVAEKNMRHVQTY